MDYRKLRKWLLFFDKEGVSAEDAIVLITFYVRNLVGISYLGFDEEEYQGSLFSRKVEKKDDGE